MNERDEEESVLALAIRPNLFGAAVHPELLMAIILANLMSPESARLVGRMLAADSLPRPRSPPTGPSIGGRSPQTNV